MSSTFTIKRWNTFNKPIPFKDSNGVALDLTDSIVYFTVRKGSTLCDPDDSSANITKRITDHTDAEWGITTLSLTENDTNLAPGEYVYEFQIKFVNGEVTSSCTGEFIVKQDVTKSTS